MSNVRPLVKKADIVQIKPEHDEIFGGCLLVVSEVHKWGVQGYVMIPGEEGKGGQAYYRCKYASLVLTGGSAPYVIGDEFEGEGIPLEELIAQQGPPPSND